MARRSAVTAHGAIGRFQQYILFLALCLCLGGCTPPTSEVAINSPRYDVAQALWVIGRMHKGDKVWAVFRSSYEALFSRAGDALTPDELDSIQNAFADMQLEDVLDLLAGFSPSDDKWLEPAGAATSDSDQVKLMRLAWDRFLRDWDAKHWRAQRASDLTGFDREWPFTDEPFVLIPRWFDVPFPKPHVLFYMPAALGTDTYLLRIDAGYAMIGDNVGRAGRTPELARLVIDTNWFLDLNAEETGVLVALAQHTDSLKTPAQAREAIIHILHEAARDGTEHMDGFMQHSEELWAEWGCPGLVAALDKRINATWAARKKLTEQDVWSVLRDWLARAGN